MDNSQKTRQLSARARQFAHVLGGLSIVAVFATVAAVFAASRVQARAFFSGREAPPTEPAIYPQFTIVPRPPQLQQISDRPYIRHTQKPAASYLGVASWYGPSFNGRLTANGEIYDMYAMTAATSEFNTTLPLGTKVRVVDSHNGRSVVVRITDRGPLPNGRIIDLSYGAARRLAMVKPGIAQVRVEVLRWGSNSYRRRSG